MKLVDYLNIQLNDKYALGLAVFEMWHPGNYHYHPTEPFYLIFNTLYIPANSRALFFERLFTW